jgi:protoporphyrinogen oxidase
MPAGTVAVLGGGVAGLSAAHELVERGFSVTVYERSARFGGKARSYGVRGSGPTRAMTCRPSTASASSRASTATCPTP